MATDTKPQADPAEALQQELSRCPCRYAGVTCNGCVRRAQRLAEIREVAQRTGERDNG